MVLDHVAVASLPDHGVPPQILACACPLFGVERYRATRSGPGSLRDPMDKSHGDDEDASDEDIKGEEQCVEQPADDGSAGHDQCAHHREGEEEEEEEEE